LQEPQLIILLVATVLVLTFFVGCEEEAPIVWTEAKFLTELGKLTDDIDVDIAIVSITGKDINVEFKEDDVDLIKVAVEGFIDDLKIIAKSGSTLKIIASNNTYNLFGLDVVQLALDVKSVAEADVNDEVQYSAKVVCADNTINFTGKITFENIPDLD
jgi:hypothetical protein